MKAPGHTLASALPDLSWVTEALAIGGRFATNHVRHLSSDLRVRRVVDLRAEDADDVALLESAGIDWLHLPTPDLAAASPDHLDLGVAWIREGLARGERVLVHCEHGIGRSAVLACCVLVAAGLDPKDALLLAKDARAKVSPSPNQLHAYLAWARRDALANGRAPSSTTWDELACIAYRHLAKTS